MTPTYQPINQSTSHEALSSIATSRLNCYRQSLKDRSDDEVWLRLSEEPCLACRPSATLVDQDHIGWKTWKLIMHGQLAQHLRSSLPKGHPPIPWRTWENFVETRGGVGKSGRAQ